MITNGYSIAFKEIFCYIHDLNDILLVTTTIVEKSFHLRQHNLNDKAKFTTYKESILWRRRYGCSHILNLKNMPCKYLAKDLPEISVVDEICDACQYVKMHRQAFLAKVDWRAKEKLELIHFDIYKPMSIKSLNDNMFLLLFIDDLIRMTWVSKS